MTRGPGCADLEARLEELVSGRLGAADRAACERHLGECAQCAELVELATIPPPAAAGDPSLAAAVLRRTSGVPCDAAAPLLLARLDGELRPEAAGTLALHVEHCAGCRAIERSLRALADDLPRLADLPPGDDFVARVMVASLPLTVRLRRWRRSTWPRWVRRPRFALEMAYGLTALLVVVLNIPGTPLAAMPRQAVELARTSPVEALEEPVRDGLAVWQQSSTRRQLRSAWSGAEAQVRTFFAGAASWWENATEDTSSRQAEPTEETP